MLLEKYCSLQNKIPHARSCLFIFRSAFNFLPAMTFAFIRLYLFPLNSRQLSASQRRAPLTFFIWEKKRRARERERERATRIWARLVWMSINHRSHSPPFDIFWYILIWKYKGVEKSRSLCAARENFCVLAHYSNSEKRVSECLLGLYASLFALLENQQGKLNRFSLLSSRWSAPAERCLAQHKS